MAKCPVSHVRCVHKTKNPVSFPLIKIAKITNYQLQGFQTFGNSTINDIVTPNDEWKGLKDGWKAF